MKSVPSHYTHSLNVHKYKLIMLHFTKSLGFVLYRYILASHQAFLTLEKFDSFSRWEWNKSCFPCLIKTWKKPISKIPQPSSFSNLCMNPAYTHKQTHWLQRFIKDSSRHAHRPIIYIIHLTIIDQESVATNYYLKTQYILGMSTF